MIKKDDIYSRTKEDLLNIIAIQGEGCKKIAQKLKSANRTLREKNGEITSLNYKIKLLNAEIRRLKNEKR